MRHIRQRDPHICAPPAVQRCGIVAPTRARRGPVGPARAANRDGHWLKMFDAVRVRMYDTIRRCRFPNSRIERGRRPNPGQGQGYIAAGLPVEQANGSGNFTPFPIIDPRKFCHTRGRDDDGARRLRFGLWGWRRGRRGKICPKHGGRRELAL